jgi:hopanoid-associated phosphorylase
MGAAGSGDVPGALPVIVVCGLGFEARLAAGPGAVVLCGPDAGRLERLLGPDACAWGGIISFGTAGGLDPALRPGTCVLADAIVTPAARLAVDACWLRAWRARLPQAVVGAVAGVDAALAATADKARLWHASGACAVDMESHRAALAARRHDLPFAACRVVVDPAQRSLPPCAVAGLGEAGTVAVMAVLRSLAAGPAQLPALVGLAADAHAARRGLRAARAAIGAAFCAPRSA